MTQTRSTSPAAPQVHRQNQIGRQTALVAGFGVLLILMGIISVDSLRTLRTIQANDTQIRQDFLYREHTLEKVRTSVYESGDIMSDYTLIESDPHTQERLRTEFQSLHNETAASLKACIQSLPMDKRESFQHLAERLERYWSSVDPIFALRATAKKGLGNAALRSNVLSKYAEVLAITKQVSTVNDDELKEIDRRIAETFAKFRRRLLMVATIAFSFGLILAVATIMYTARLEKSIEEKYDESLRAQLQLKGLSKRLVDAQEQERRAISRELHDEVGQALSALLMDVETLSAKQGENDVFRNGLKNIKVLAENCVNEVRNMALLLRPSMLDDLGLVAAIEWQAREVSKRTGMLVNVVKENVSDFLPDEHKTCVYRIVQEALNNCSKHAYARNVRVILHEDPGHLLLTIEDDGKGFDANRGRGLGLVGMSERVTQLGGVFAVDSDPGHGTCLRVDLPFAKESAGLNQVTT
jgi:signal transduction histidine kinase